MTLKECETLHFRFPLSPGSPNSCLSLQAERIRELVSLTTKCDSSEALLQEKVPFPATQRCCYSWLLVLLTPLGSRMCSTTSSPHPSLLSVGSIGNYKVCEVRIHASAQVPFMVMLSLTSRVALCGRSP